jgi:hypothetical protein
MNYAKIVGSAIQLFPKRIKVILINDTTGEKISTSKIGIENLPDAFNRPTILEIDGVAWRILRADPVLADDFSFSNKLTLRVLQASSVQSPASLYEVPTIVDQFPLSSQTALFTNCMIEMDCERWSQIELLPLALLPAVQEEMIKIEAILTADSGHNVLLGYTDQHKRGLGNGRSLSIPFDEFCDPTIHEKGAIQLRKGGFAQDAFVLRSASYTWYGTVQSNMINHLCLKEYDSLDDELYTVLNRYELVLVDWCNAKILTIHIKNENLEDSILESDII